MTTAILVLARTLHIGGAMLLVAFPFFMLVVFSPATAIDSVEGYGAFSRKIVKWLWGAWLMEGVSGIVWFWFVTAQMSDKSPWEILDLSDVTTVLGQTQFGQLWLMRAVVGVAFGVMIYLISGRRTGLSSRSSVLNWLASGMSGVLLVTLAWAGHAASGVRFHALHLATDSAHLLLGAIWPAGLIPLLCFLWYIHKGELVVSADRTITILQRFSRISLGVVLVLVLTGMINGWLMVGSWDGLVTTLYGKLLLVKVIVVGFMIALGAVNRLIVLPGLEVEPHWFQTLRRTILVESLLALVVLLMVGKMGTTSPPS